MEITSEQIEKLNKEELKKQCLEYYWGIAKLNDYWGSKIWKLEEEKRNLEIELLKRIKK